MFELFAIVTPFGIGLCILGVPFFVFAGGILFLIAGEKEVPAEKAKWRKRAWWTMATPLVIVVFLLILWGLVQTTRSLY
jgi:cytochrome bd-type quinol oxidase subunit 2